MLQDCLREFSAFDGGRPDAQGRFDYPYLDAYWQEEGRSPFVFLREGNEVGFAFVRRLGEIEVEMAEFYVMPRFRRTGVAQGAAGTAALASESALAQRQPGTRLWPGGNFMNSKPGPRRPQMGAAWVSSAGG